MMKVDTNNNVNLQIKVLIAESDTLAVLSLANKSWELLDSKSRSYVASLLAKNPSILTQINTFESFNDYIKLFKKQGF